MKYVWHKETKCNHLHPITQVYGVCFTIKGEIVIIKEENKKWNIPGGTPEGGETPIDTLKRECIEEAQITIDNCQMIGYFEVQINDSTIYQLRYACDTIEVLPQVIDHGSTTLNQRKFVNPNEFFDYVHIKDYEPMIEAAVSWYSNKTNS